MTRRHCITLLHCIFLAIMALPALGQTAAAPPSAGTADVVPATTGDDAKQAPLASPQATMFTFLEAMNRVNDGYEDAWPTALATMDFSGAGDAEPGQRELAEMLLDILDRMGEVKPDELPDARDLQRMREGGKAVIRRFLFFPRPMHAWVWEELDEAPVGKIALAANDAGEWRFTARTLGELPQLFESLMALPPRHLADRSESRTEVFSLLGPTFERTPWWGWVALLSCIFLGLLAGKIAQSVLRNFGDRWTQSGWRIRGITFHNTASPASFALLAVGIMVGLGFIYMEDDVREFANNIIEFLFVVAVGWVLFNLVDVIDAALRHLAETTDSKLDDQVVPLIRKTLRVFLVIVFTLVVAQNIFGLNITGWLAGLGIAGLAVSLAAQDSIKNLFGSITIFFDKPFTVGDFVKFDDETGKVEEIGFRSTRLRLLSGHLVTVPNMMFIDRKVENITARPYIRREMNVTITYDTPPQKIEEAVQIVRDVLHDPEVIEVGRFNMDDNPPKIAFNEFNSDSLNIRAYYWYQMAGDADRGFFTFLEHAQIVNMKLFRAFEHAGIDFAFPTQTLYLAGDPSRQLAVQMLPADRDDDE